MVSLKTVVEDVKRAGSMRVGSSAATARLPRRPPFATTRVTSRSRVLSRSGSCAASRASRRRRPTPTAE
eukprot:7218165-Lingulodinium_polyedra.AAC.1